MGGLTSLLLLLCIGVTVSTVLDLQKRVIGGHECLNNERGHHVKFIRHGGGLLCGGSLLENNWILTAAHCWEWAMEAVVGVHPGPELDTVRIKAPPVMYKDKKNRIHDIMLLRLPPLPNPVQIEPVDLPDCKKKPKPGHTVQIAGFAATTKDPDNTRRCDTPTDLQCANITLSDCKRLKKIMKTHPLHRYSDWFCGDTSTVDACPGDSGGGVMVGNMIYGVISFTGNATYAHAADAGFMDVCKYIKWIEDTIGIERDRKVGCFGCG